MVRAFRPRKLVDIIMKVGRFGRKTGVHRRSEIVCKECGITFYSWEDNKFCSQKCYWKSMKGKKVFSIISPEERENRRQRMMGENNPMWCGGDSDKERRNSQYKNWRIDVFKRDDFTCQDCGYRNGDGTVRKDLNAHHIVRWIDSIELRYEIDNGMTLCVPCHIKEHQDR